MRTSSIVVLFSLYSHPRFETSDVNSQRFICVITNKFNESDRVKKTKEYFVMLLMTYPEYIYKELYLNGLTNVVLITKKFYFF